MNTLQTKSKNEIIRFLIAQTISLFGSSLVQYAIIWYITLTTSSGIMLTISTICGFVPQIFISFFAGPILDQYNRKKIILISDSCIAISTGILAILFLSGYSSIWILYIVLIIRALGTGIQTPATQSVLPQITPPEHLMKINGIYSTITSVTMFLSPAISGAILSISSFEVTLLIDVVTALIGVGITSTVSIPKIINLTKTTMLSNWKEGLHYVSKHKLIKNILMMQLISLFLISPSAFLTPLLVSRTFGVEIWRLTFSEMTYSIGSIVGGILISTWGGFKKKLHTTLLAGLFYGVCMVGLGLSPYFILYLFINTCIGITAPCYNAPITATIQEKVVPEMHGRIFSFMQITSSCALPIGMMCFGPLSDLFSIQLLFVINGCMMILFTFYMKRIQKIV